MHAAVVCVAAVVEIFLVVLVFPRAGRWSRRLGRHVRVVDDQPRDVRVVVAVQVQDDCVRHVGWWWAGPVGSVVGRWWAGEGQLRLVDRDPRVVRLLVREHGGLTYGVMGRGCCRG